MLPDAPSATAGEAAFVDALIGDGPLAGVHDGKGRPAADRLRVYRNTVVGSLQKALAATFPATARLMGEDYFEAAAVAFAKAHKPASPVLTTYGAGFADFLATLPGLAAYPFVPEVAALEFASIGAYHAADAPPLALDRLAAVPPAALASLVFEPHPAAAALRLPHGGYGAYRVNAPHAQPTATASEGVAAAGALVSRPQMAVCVTPLALPGLDFAMALLAGAPLGEAAEHTADLDLVPVLGRLLQAGAFCGVRPATA